MTVSAYILDPQNDFEKNFSIPVATEKFFYECWMSGIEALELTWLQLISPGLYVKEEDIPVIFAELDQLKNWVNQNVKGEDAKSYFFTRAKLLEEKLPTAFQRKDAVIHIG